MKKLMIADDEFSIREGLKCIIDWNSLGFTLCAEATTGEEALHFIKQYDPDLVLMDVKMPKMTGTEVIRKARTDGFNGKCIILSGFSDIKYAQEAIRAGVTSYLTKPIDEDELLSTVISIKEQMEAEYSEHSRLSQLTTKAKNTILYDLICSDIENAFNNEDLSRMNLSASHYQVVICEHYAQGDPSISYSFSDLLHTANRDNSIFEQIVEKGHQIILLKGASGLERLSSLLAHYDGQELEKGSLLDSLFLTIGRPVTDPSQIHLSYLDAEKLLSRQFFCPQAQHYLSYESLPKEASDTESYELDTKAARHYCSLFVDYIKSFNRKLTANTLLELEHYVGSTTADENSIRMFLIDLYLLIREQLIASYATIEIPFENNSNVIQFISSQKKLYRIIRYFSEQFEMIMNATGNPSRDTILDDVIYYIDHNFQQNIKLETIAPLFGYNSAYLGKIFNKTVGENFNSYIDHKRIEHSKELLLNNQLKVYEIAEQIGYKNVDYFHKKFKKYVGMSPAEYRKGM